MSSWAPEAAHPQSGERQETGGLSGKRLQASPAGSALGNSAQGGQGQPPLATEFWPQESQNPPPLGAAPASHSPALGVRGTQRRSHDPLKKHCSPRTLSLSGLGRQRGRGTGAPRGTDQPLGFCLLALPSKAPAKSRRPRLPAASPNSHQAGPWPRPVEIGQLGPDSPHTWGQETWDRGQGGDGGGSHTCPEARVLPAHSQPPSISLGLCRNGTITWGNGGLPVRAGACRKAGSGHHVHTQGNGVYL